MFFRDVMTRFEKLSPLTVQTRALLAYAMSASKLNTVFRNAAVEPYEQELLFFHDGHGDARCGTQYAHIGPWVLSRPKGGDPATQNIFAFPFARLALRLDVGWPTPGLTPQPPLPEGQRGGQTPENRGPWGPLCFRERGHGRSVSPHVGGEAPCGPRRPTVGLAEQEKCEYILRCWNEGFGARFCPWKQ